MSRCANCPLLPGMILSLLPLVSACRHRLGVTHPHEVEHALERMSVRVLGVAESVEHLRERRQDGLARKGVRSGPGQPAEHRQDVREVIGKLGRLLDPRITHQGAHAHEEHAARIVLSVQVPPALERARGIDVEGSGEVLFDLFRRCIARKAGECPKTVHQPRV